MKISKTLDTKKLEEGFSLVEVLVAIFIGMIVMTSSVAILGATNSSALRVLAKSESQVGSRSAMLTTFARLNKAESPQICVLATTNDLQNNLVAAKDLWAVNGGLGQHYPAKSEESECAQLAPAGLVIVSAMKNQVCYLRGRTPYTNPQVYLAPSVPCITLGNVKGPASVKGVKPGNEIPLSNCTNELGKDPNSLYEYNCLPADEENWRNWLYWLNPYTRQGDVNLIADMGGQECIPSGSDRSTFRYILSDGSSRDQVTDYSELQKIIAVEVDLTFCYQTHLKEKVGSYHFRHTVVLNGSNYARESNYDN